ncbi:MAG: glycosyltransferase family 2 protein [Anaerolineaceae bacterium]|nr:glycosyltransferase family 2 protein [Anaerolineaceae bacterium]
MPSVSIIVPCYNEQATIGLLLQAVHMQTYPRENLEVVIADGISSDHTREEIAIFQSAHPDLCVRIVDNPQKAIPAALNRAITAAHGEYLVRLDAHSVPEADYVERCLADLQQGLGDNVGGVWNIQPGASSWLARAIAVVAAHPLGVGDARYRYTSQAGAVDTVPFGAFPRKLIDRIGPFDETLLTNEDYEFNTRIRQHGGVVWLDPSIRSVYFARSTLVELARQYWRYGYWKQRMLRRYPGSLRWRQALPPLFVGSLVVVTLVAPFLSPARWLLAAELLVYLSVLFLAGAQMAIEKQDAGLGLGVPLGIATMHLSWGSGFLWSLVSNLFMKRQ